MAPRVFAAVDLGASSGRVIAGLVDHDGTKLRVVHRFPNELEETDGHLRWNLTGLYAEVLHGLRLLAAEYPQVESIGIDTWAVDYGLLGAGGRLLAEPIAYRDQRTSAVIEAVHRRVDPEALYAINGLQFLPFNTLYQLVAEQDSSAWADAVQVVLLPDLLAYWLTGELRTEATNASTTGLVDVRRGTWSTELLAALDIPEDRLPPIEQPGTVRGPVLPELGLPAGLVVTTVGSHDTASAVVGLPATSRSCAYVSSGTWSLVGLELDEPVLSAESRAANFTNEGGVDGRTRFLRNVGGLWLLEECLRTWRGNGEMVDLSELLDEASQLPLARVTFDVDDPSFIPAGDMPDRITDAVRARGGEPLDDPAALTRCIIDSLATAYATTIEQAVEIAGHPVETVHIVGGGSQNVLLCQCTADLTGLPVTAGPVEATALGNVLVQARTHDAAPSTLEEIRGGIAAGTDLGRYDPRASPSSNQSNEAAPPTA